MPYVASKGPDLPASPDSLLNVIILSIQTPYLFTVCLLTYEQVLQLPGDTRTSKCSDGVAKSVDPDQTAPLGAV